jgi:hypothetical protein
MHEELATREEQYEGIEHAAPSGLWGGWANRPLGDLIDHLADRRAFSLAAIDRARESKGGVARTRLRSVLGQLGVVWEAQWAFERSSVFPRIRALEAARLGCGAWPDTFPGGLRTAIESLERAGRTADDLLHALAACIDEETGMAPSWREELNRLAASLGTELALRERVLYPRAELLEADPRA